MTGRPPSFSVIIPTHNRRALVERAVDSALAAAPGDGMKVEVVVVDDASTDDTVAVLRARHGRDPRVRLLGLETNAGPSVARNRGLAAATGDLVLFLDSDDVLMPQALAMAAAAFRQTPQLQYLSLEGEATDIDTGAVERGIVRGGCPGWSAEGMDDVCLRTRSLDAPAGTKGRAPVLQAGDLFPAVLFGDLFYLSGLVIRHHAALSAGPFNPRYRYFEDWDFVARLCLTGTGGYLDQIGFHRETGRSDQLSNVRTLWRNAVMHQHVLATVRATGRVDHPESRRLMQRAQAAADYWMGRCLLERHHGRIARAYLVRSLARIHKPLKSLAWLLGGRWLATTPRYTYGP